MTATTPEINTVTFALWSSPWSETDEPSRALFRQRVDRVAAGCGKERTTDDPTAERFDPAAGRWVFTWPIKAPDVDDDRHPEAHCHRCGGPNVAWSAPSPLWNEVMRGGSINGDEEYDGIVCPTCFATLAEERDVASMWRLSAEWVDVELETVTPTGRTWDEAAWLWRGAPGAAPECDPAADTHVTPHRGCILR